MPCGPDAIHAFKMSSSLRFKSDSLHWHNDGKLNYYQWIRHSMCRVYKYEHVLCDPVRQFLSISIKSFMYIKHDLPAPIKSLEMSLCWTKVL